MRTGASFDKWLRGQWNTGPAEFWLVAIIPVFAALLFDAPPSVLVLGISVAVSWLSFGFWRFYRFMREDMKAIDELRDKWAAGRQSPEYRGREDRQ